MLQEVCRWKVKPLGHEVEDKFDIFICSVRIVSIKNSFSSTDSTLNICLSRCYIYSCSIYWKSGKSPVIKKPQKKVFWIPILTSLPLSLEGQGRDGPWPELTFVPQLIRGRTAFDLGTFWPDPKRFFLLEGKKMEKIDIFKGNFPNPNHRWLTQPDLSHKKLTQPGAKNFDPDPSLG